MLRVFGGFARKHLILPTALGVAGRLPGGCLSGRGRLAALVAHRAGGSPSRGGRPARWWAGSPAGWLAGRHRHNPPRTHKVCMREKL